MRRYILFALLASLAAAPSSRAAGPANSRTLTIMQPADLPEAVRQSGQSMKLHMTSDGRTYLYLEQHQLGRIVVLDVTDPSRIKTAAMVSVAAPAAFDFDRDLGEHAMLLRYRDGKGIAILDLTHPRQPEITAADPALQSTSIQKLGDSGYIGENISAMPVIAPRDYQIIDSSHPLKPRLMATVAQVEVKVTNSFTGTTYLLNSAGLTVVRRTDVELQQELFTRN